MDHAISLLTLFKAIHCTVYVLTGDHYDTAVTMFTDAASLFGPGFFQTDGPLVPASPPDACLPLDLAPNISLPTKWLHSDSSSPAIDFVLSPIVLIEEGSCAADVKIFNAQQSGYSGAIVFRTIEGDISPMIGSTLASRIEIPSVLVTKKAGERLKTYTWSRNGEYLVSLTGYYGWPTKYVLLCLLLVVIAIVVILASCLAIHLCNSCYRRRRGRLSKRQLRRLRVKRFTKSQDPYETCAICLEDYEERQKLRLLPCQHAFHRGCIDRWLLSNRCRCPVCNRTVDFSTANSSDPQLGLVSLPQRLLASVQRLHWFISSNRIGSRFRTRDRTERLGSTAESTHEDDTSPLLGPDYAEEPPCPLLHHTCQSPADPGRDVWTEPTEQHPLQALADLVSVPAGSKHQLPATTKTGFAGLSSSLNRNTTEIDTDDDDELLSATDHASTNQVKQFDSGASPGFIV